MTPRETAEKIVGESRASDDCVDATIRSLTDAIAAAIEKAGKDDKDGERYRFLRGRLYTHESVVVGEAYVRMKAIGGCPSVEDFDRAIDEAAAKGGGDGDC